MRRFKNISLFGSSLYDYEPPKQKNGPFIVDDSSFIPMSEAVKQLSRTNPLGTGYIEGAYDFPDGIDTGMHVPVARMRPELPELSQEAYAQNKQLRKDVAKAQKIAKDKQFYEQLKQSHTVVKKE